MSENALLIDLDELDVTSVELPSDDTPDGLATGYGTTEIGASCGSNCHCNCLHSRLV